MYSTVHTSKPSNNPFTPNSRGTASVWVFLVSFG